jgi:hypothetical protein
MYDNRLPTTDNRFPTADFADFRRFPTEDRNCQLGNPFEPRTTRNTRTKHVGQPPPAVKTTDHRLLPTDNRLSTADER